MPHLIHLNGPPGVGKSTLARVYASRHPGTLVCEIDALRTLISGWQTNRVFAGYVHNVATSMVTSYLKTGHDVILPHLADLDRIALYAAAAEEGGGRHIHVMLHADMDAVVRQFRERGTTRPDSWTHDVARFWDARGGDDAIRDCASDVWKLPHRFRIDVADQESAYQSLVRTVEGSAGQNPGVES